MRYQAKALRTEGIEPRPIVEDISVVIPTLGRPILEECFYWIVDGSAWPGGVIVVDQGSSQHVKAWTEALRPLGIDARHVPSSQRGRSAGINRGLEQVRTRFVAVTDDDCFVGSDWAETIANRLRDNPEAIVTGRVEAAGEGVLVVVTSLEPAVYSRPRLKFDSMSGGNMGTSMSVINRVGCFDENPCLRTAEDAEWAYRALRAGVPIIYAPEVVVRHFGWRDDDKRLIQYKDYARSHGGFYGKYLRQGDWFIALRAVIHHGRALRRCLRGVMTGNQDLALYGWSYFTGLMPGIIAGLKQDRFA
jgi:GT2 family glycosyltransferase